MKTTKARNEPKAKAVVESRRTGEYTYDLKKGVGTVKYSPKKFFVRIPTTSARQARLKAKVENMTREDLKSIVAEYVQTYDPNDGHSYDIADQILSALGFSDADGAKGGSMSSTLEPDWLAVDEMPKQIGLWYFRCEETSNIAEKVAITARGTRLTVHTEELGSLPLSSFHDGLTRPQWRHIA